MLLGEEGQVSADFCFQIRAVRGSREAPWESLPILTQTPVQHSMLIPWLSRLICFFPAVTIFLPSISASKLISQPTPALRVKWFLIISIQNPQRFPSSFLSFPTFSFPLRLPPFPHSHTQPHSQPSQPQETPTHRTHLLPAVLRAGPPISPSCLTSPAPLAQNSSASLKSSSVKYRS